jgi:hypothetical protein
VGRALGASLLFVLLTGAALAARTGVVVVPRPSFPAPVVSVTPSGPTRLAVVSAHAHAPQLSGSSTISAWMPERLEGFPLLQAVRQAGVVFLVYGRDGASARFLVGANPRTHAIRYAFDLGSFARPPHVVRRGRTLCSPALVANARTFVLAGDALVTGYGLTREPDYLYLIDRATGKVRDRLPVPSAPETIARRGNRLFVRTYDHDIVAVLRPR